MSREKTVYIETYGCQMNVYDSAAIHDFLARDGFLRTDDPARAGIVLLNTCSVRDLAEHKIISRIGELRSLTRRGELNVDLIGLCGCMAERLGETFMKGHNRPDLVVGVDRYDRLPGILTDLLESGRSASAVSIGHLADMHYVAPPEAMPTNNSHLVTIHKGCDYRCTYCIVPATRGPQREKKQDVIIEEIRNIVAAGGREVTLLGQNVTAYRNNGGGFADLLAAVSAIDGLERIRFLTGHPHDMDRELIEAVAALPKVCPWLHVPAQSGANRILKRMKRLYTAERYIEMVDTARSLIPDVTFSGDFIVGFPGETDAEFRQTLDLVRHVRYDQTFNFKYSERPDTPAARLVDDVPEAEKKSRLALLMDLQQEIWEDISAGCIGETWTVWCEGRARRPQGAVKCRTANNRKVLIENCDAGLGDALRVKIAGHRKTTFLGEIITDER